MEKNGRSESRLKEEVRARAIEWIKENGRPRYGQAEFMANIFDVTPRTLRNWCCLVESGAAMKKIGRPSHLQEDIAAAKPDVLAMLEKIGYTIGEKRTYEGLAGKHSRRAVRGALRELKLEHRRRVAHEREVRRLTIEYVAKDVQWCQDGTQLERTSDGVITTEVVRDAATTDTGGLAPKLGAPDAQTAIAAFDAMVVARGALPLVISIDNGAPYTSKEFFDMLEARGVIVLRNLPHTPRHNAVAERAVREVKDEANLVLLGPETPPMPPVDEWKKRLQVAQERLHARIRPGCRQGQTTAELDNSLPKAEAIVDRSVFYAAAKEAMAAARQAHEKPRAARIAERHALIRVLLKFGLVRVRVGGVPLSAANSEILL